MQLFDGTQPELSIQEQYEAGEELSKLVGGTLLAFSASIEYPSPTILGSRAPKLNLHPLLKNTGVDSGFVAQAYNERGNWSYVRLEIAENDGSIGSALYKVEADGIARRCDTGSRADELKLVMGGERESIAERDANVELEQQMGMNNCPVDVREVRALGALITQMAPDTI